MRRSESLRPRKVRQPLRVERLEGRTLLSAQIDNPQLNQLVSSLGGPIQVPETQLEPVNQHITATAAAPITSNVVAGQQSGELTLATFTDPDPTATAGDYRALIFWGDNTTSMVTPDGPTNGQFTVTAHHTFQTAGMQNVKILILDTDSATTSTLTQFQPTLLAGAVDANADNAATVQVPVTVAASTAAQPLAVQGGTVFAPQNRQFIHPIGLLTVNNPTGTTTGTTAGTTTTTLSGLQAFIDWGDGTSSPGLIAFTNGFENGFRTFFTSSPTATGGTTTGGTTGTPTNALTFFVIGAHRYRRRGVFTATVTVVDSNGDMASDQSTIVVGRPTRAQLNSLAGTSAVGGSQTTTGTTGLTTARTPLAVTLAAHARARVHVAVAHPTRRHH